MSLSRLRLLIGRRRSFEAVIHVDAMKDPTNPISTSYFLTFFSPGWPLASNLYYNSDMAIQLMGDDLHMAETILCQQQRT